MLNIKKFLKYEDLLKTIVVKSLKFLKNKVDYAEVSIKKSIGHNFLIRTGKLETLELNDDIYISIIVYKNNRKGSASSNNLKWSSIKKTIFTAIEISEQTYLDKYLIVPKKKYFFSDYVDLKTFYPIMYTLKEILKLTILTENYSINFDHKIFNSEGSNFYSSNSIFVFGNTYNIIKSYKTSIYFLSISVLAKNKSSVKSNFNYTLSRNFNTLDKPKKIGEKCSKMVLKKLNSKKIISQKIPVIFSKEISNSLFKHLFYAIQGVNVYKKSTFLLNFLNKKIFPSWLNIFENSQLLGGLGSRLFDNEGIFSKPKYIIKNGILKTWLLDNYSSNRLNLKNTGNSGEIYNWIFSNTLNQKFFFKDLLKKMKTGVIINELMGQGVDINTGNYSRGASGFWVENSKIKYPISEITVSGNLKKIYKNIICMSNDTNFKNEILSGSILVKSANISGL
ncbi:metallopeptidase TldD-related protein [Buchnera aphidicola]|uniref:metallopeptidase TldD-related protein n=1 Tax=Buchnera aphidicola TaxID=9 RepID=UPI0030ED6337